MYSVPKIKKEISLYRYLYDSISCPSLALADHLSCRKCNEMFALRNNLLCRKSKGLVADILLLLRVTCQSDCNGNVSDFCYDRDPIFLKPQLGALDNI
jgi:hypothetical protein